MRKFKIINKVAAAVTVVCTLLFTSCEDPVADDVVLDVSVKTPQVTSAEGQMFVIVKSSLSWTLSIADGSEWAELNITSGTGDKNVILTYQANTEEDPRTLRLVLDNGLSVSECAVTQDGTVQKEEPQPAPPGINLSATGWLELPAMDNESLEYFTHGFEMNGSRYRNFSFGWSHEHLVSLWMAYPLCSMYTNKTVSRTNEWAYDPLLGAEYSSAPFGGYGGWYARGHQVPSADRLCCHEANAQTFYGTNMTPQLNEHNEGIWSSLEGWVRNIANTSDTTYVVTGCVVKGSTEFTQDSDGKKMTVPVAYYKVLLRYSKSSTMSTWAAAAFYTEHKDYVGYTPFKDIAMSVDALEEKLGMDFYVNLPSKLGEARAAEIEAEDPLRNSIWGL